MNPIEHGALVSYTFLMTLTPGPTTLMVALSGARFGFARSVPHMAGALVGYELQLLAAVAGLATVVDHAPLAVTALRWVSVLYLLYLGWRMLGAGMLSAAGQAVPLRATEAAALQLLNPKSWFMALATVSLFLPAGDADRSTRLALLLWAGVAGSAGMCIWATCGTGLRHWLDCPRRRVLFNRCMAGALLLTAGWSLWS
jgi:threonine/homoserine/homoserine lactone efflux protein